MADQPGNKPWHVGVERRAGYMQADTGTNAMSAAARWPLSCESGRARLPHRVKMC
jgi:hypothetical protein